MRIIFLIGILVRFLIFELGAQPTSVGNKTTEANGIIIPASTLQLSPASPLVYKDESIVQFKSLGVNQGLRSSYAYALLNDYRGNLWIGSWSKGLIRYDGKSFGHYEKNPRLKNGHIWKLFEDSNHRIWMGTREGGAICFDGVNFTVYKDTVGGLRSNQVYDIFEDKEGSIWFATYNGVSKLKNQTFTHFGQEDGLDNIIVRSIIQDNEGTIWAGTWGAGIHKFDGKAFNKQTMPFEKSAEHNFIWTMILDHKGSMWISSWGQGVLMYENQQFYLFNEAQGLPNLNTRPLFEDKDGNIWVGTEAGVYVLSGNEFQIYDIEDGLSNNFVYSITQDQDGIIWIGTEGGGISQFSQSVFKHFTTKNGLGNSVILCMAQDAEKHIWFGGKRKGISIYNGNYFYPFKHNEIIGNWGIRHIYHKPETQNIWIGTWGGGLFVYNKEQDILKQFTKEDGFISDYLTNLCRDDEGNLWIGTYTGLMKIDRSFDPFKSSSVLDSSTLFIHDSFRDLPIRKILKDHRGGLWIGTQGKGLAHFDGTHVRWLSPYFEVQNLSSYTLLEDSYQRLWIGTLGEGVYYLNLDDFYEHIAQVTFSSEAGNTKGEILPWQIHQINPGTEFQSLSVSMIQESEPGHIWLGTDVGVISLLQSENSHSFISRTYNTYDGFTGGSVSLNSGLVDQDGNIWWGTGKHLSLQKSISQGQAENSTPIVYVSNISVLGTKGTWQSLVNHSEIKYSALSPWEGLPEELSLSYQHNHISFGYRGINWKEPEKTKYQYQLHGLESIWNPLTSETNISYANLKPNKYTFKVQAVSTSGVWSEIASFPFVIRPPFWQQLWFRLCMGVALIFVGFIIYQWNIQRLQSKWKAETLEEQRKKLSYLVDARTRELKRSNEELERFAYIASHDLKTPLRNIISFLGLIERKTKDLSEEIQEYVGFAKDAASHMHELIQGILAFSRLEQIEKTQVNLNEVMQQVKKNLQSFIESKNAEIQIDDLPTLEADHTQMIQLFQNLIENSITYNESSQPRVFIRYILGERYKEFSIQDNGIGIAPEYHHQIFKMFSRLHSAQEYKGTGLGLALCDKVMKLHDGQIRVSSEAGKGTTFFLRFPIEQNHPNQSNKNSNI